MAEQTDGIHFSIELLTNDPAKILRLTDIEKFADGSGYASTLTVAYAGFSCLRPFYFDDGLLRIACSHLREMAAGNAQTARISGLWEPDYIELRSNDMGHVFVSGEIHEFTEFTQQLKFVFRTDQTALAPLLNDIQALIAAPPTD